MVNRTVEQVVERGLCTGCGTCVSLCPKSAVSLFVDKKSQVYLAKVNDKFCVNCGLCLKVCPGHAVDFAALNKQFLGKDLPSDRLGILLGNYLNCYTGYASDPQIRFDSSSGGLVTQLLIFALEEGIIDGALVTRMRKDNPLEPEPFIARTKQEIVEASKSKYCPVPANIALKEILGKDGKYAVVGLPCQIHGIRKAELINKKLKDQIVLHIGLFCGGNDSFYETQYLLYRWNIKPEAVSKIDYRGGGWPGILTIRLKSGQKITCPLLDWVTVHEFSFFSQRRCLLCCDHTSELADISCGDAWLPQFSGDTFGTSVMILRTEMAEVITNKAMQNRKIALQKVAPLVVAKSAGMVRFKKNGVNARFLLFKLRGENLPVYSVKLLSPRVVDYARSFLATVDNSLGQKRFLWRSFEFFAVIQKQLKKAHLKTISQKS